MMIDALKGMWSETRNRAGRLEAAKKFMRENAVYKITENTKFFKNAMALDGGEVGKYWSKPDEMFARAFEAYVSDKLQEGNRYLVDTDFVAPGGVETLFNRDNGAYPTAEERERFNRLFDNMFDQLEWSEKGEPHAKEGYNPITTLERKEAKEAVQKLLKRIDAVYEALYGGKASAGGLYWYAYEQSARGVAAQPKGYLAYDDSYQLEKGEGGVEYAGKGAVAYDQPLKADDALSFFLKAVDHPGGDTIIKLEVPDGTITDMGDRGSEALAEAPSEHGSTPGSGGGAGEVGPGGPGEGAGSGSGLDAEGVQPGGSEGDSLTDDDLLAVGGGGTDTSSNADAVHVSERLDYIIRNTTDLENTNLTDRFNNNIAAIRTLKQIEAENRTATAAEQEILVKYNGWGELSEALGSYPNPAWAGRAEIVKSLLTDQERWQLYENAVDAYYTPPSVAALVHEALGRLGFMGGKVLEPSCGIGHFFGTMARETRRNSLLTGVDIDPISARIAAQLYQNANILNQPFEKTAVPNNFYDLTISNVPFGQTEPVDRTHNLEEFQIHDYFISKMINITKPGGLTVVLTSTGTMDKEDAKARRKFAESADLVSAIRLPNGVFPGAFAGADILIFRKKGEGLPALPTVPDWVESKAVILPEVDSNGNFIAGSTPRRTQVNNFFQAVPENVLGDLAVNSGRYGAYRPYVAMKSTYRDDLRSAIDRLPVSIYGQDRAPIELDFTNMIPEAAHVKNYNYYVGDNGKIYQNRDGRPSLRDNLTPKEQEFMKGVIGIRGIIRNLLRAQVKKQSAADLTVLRKQLRTAYDQLVKTYGPINKPENARLIVDDPDGGLLLSLEKWDRGTKTVTGLADIFFKNTLAPVEPPTSADTSHESLLYSLQWRGRVDLAYMGQLTGKTRDTLIAELKGQIFDDPETGYVAADAYLSGNVRRKLAVAEAAAALDEKYKENVEALKIVMPVDLPMSDIRARLGMSWVPAQVVQSFVKDGLFGGRGIRGFYVDHVLETGMWNPHFRASTEAEAKRRKDNAMVSLVAAEEFGVVSYKKNPIGYTSLRENLTLQERDELIETFGSSEEAIREYNQNFDPDTDSLSVPLFVKVLEATGLKQYRINLFKKGSDRGLIDYALNGGFPVIEDKIEYLDENGNRKTRMVTNIALTDAANAKLAKLQARLSEWVYENDDAAAQLEKTYNERLNSFVDRQYNGEHLTFPGKVPDEIIKLRPHQKNAIWRFLQTGATYFAHEVGTGKTYTMIGSIMEARRLGLAKKPVLIVKKATVEQIAADFLRLYPGANILTIAVSKTNPQKRQRQLAQIATGNYDCVIMNHNSFERIKLSPDTQREFLHQEIQRMERVQSHADSASASQFTVRQIGQQIKALRDKLDKLSEGEEGVPTFEEMGLDLIVADEAHTHKNIGFATQFANMKGVESGKSNIALDLFLKTQYLHMRNGRGIILASGTPLTNSVGELFNIQRYLQPNELTRLGIDTFDAWANTFGVMRKEAEYAPEGGHFKMTSRFAEFVNVPELLALARQVMDVRQAKDLGIVRPDVIGGKPEPVMVEWNKFTEAFQDLLKRRIRSIRALGDKATFRGVNDNILRVVSDGRTVAMDPRLYDPTLPDYENTKVNVAVDKVWDLYQKAVDAEELDQSSKNYKQAYQEKNHLQLIFADRGVPGKKDKFNIYADIKQKLIKKGIPKEQIAFIHDAKSDDDLAALLLKARKGQIRVLIGSTPKMGIGVNVQDRVSYIHHLDVDWTYANYEQRNGRGWRYGNRIKNVGIFNYGTVKTVDAFMWSTVAYKEKVLQQIMSNNPKIRNIIDISKTSMDASEMEGLLADDPIHKEKIELDEEVRRLSNVKADYESGRRRAKEKLAKLPLMMTAAEKTIERSHIHKQIAESIMAIEFKPQHDNLGRLVEPNRHFNLETEGGKVNALARKLHAAWTAKKTADSPDSVYLGRFGRIVTVETPDAKGKPKKSRVFLPLAGHLSLTVGDTALVYKIGKDVHYQAPMADGVKSGLTDIERSLARTIQEKLKSIQDIKNETPKLEKLIATPFPQEEELARKTQRLEAITQELLARQQAEEAEARRRAVEGQQDAEMEQEDNYLQDYLRFSRGQAQSSSKASDIQAALSPVIDRWKAGPKIQIVQSLYGLPDDVKEKVQKLLSRATDADGLEGLYDPATGAVYLIADYLESADRAQQVVLHEVVGHHGMRGVLGDRFKPFLKEAVALYGQKGLKDIADLYGLDLTEEADRLIAADEKIAEMAEAGENPAFLKRLYAAIREGLRRLGFNIQLSENDIKAMLVASRKALEKAGPKSAENLEGVLGAAKKIASTDAFKKWFGNSKVVDENGEPLVVYHGSDNPEFKAFDIGRLGENTGAASALRGFFFAKSADNAEMYTTPDITSEAFLSRQKEVYDQFNKITQKREGRARQQMKSLPKPVKKAKASLRELDIAKREYDAGKLSKKQYEDRVLDANDVLDNTTKDDVAVAKKLYAQDRRLTVEFYEAKLEKDKVDYFVKMYLQRDRYAKFNPGIIPAYLSIKNPKIHDFNHEVRGDITFSEILDEAIADGNDGVIFKNVNDPITDDIYVVFSPTQIKSIFNRGTFDPSNPDIHASLKSKMRDEVTSTVQAFKKALHPKDMTFLESMLRTPEYIDHPTVKQAYDATQHREERKNEIYLKHKDPVDRLSALRKADPAEYAKVEKILDDMDVNEVKWSEMRSKSGLSAEGLAAVDSVRKTFDELLEYLRQPVKDIIDTLEKEKKNPNKPPADQGEPSIEIPLGDGRKQKYTLSQLLLLYQEMGELKGFYAPRSREPGEYFLTAKDKDGNFYRFHKGSQRQIEKLKLQLGREGYTNFRDGLVSKLPEDIQMNLNIVDMGKAIEYAVNQAVQHPALNAALQGEVLVSASNMLKARAFRAHKIARTGRDGEVVRGYITDPAQRVGNYVAQIAGGIAKAEAGQKMMAALMDVDAVKEPKRYSWLKGYVTEQMRNADRWDRAIALGKSIVSFKYLGFNPRSALVNVTAQATTAPPAILKFALGGKGSLLKIGQELFTAGKDYGAFMGGKEFANEEERTFMADVHTRGVDNPQLVREAMRELDQGFGGVWSKVMDKAMWMFGKTEQWNRGTTLLAAYRMARAQGQNAATAAKNAQLATERAHGVYGKGTLPTWAMGTNPFAKIAQTGYTFQKFAHNYVQMLFEHKLNRQDAKGLAFALAAPAVLGGASGFAGYAAAMAIARGILGAADDDRDPEKMVYDTIRKTLGDTAEKGARYGIMGLLGVDISGSLAIGLEVPKTLTDLTGPFGGVATDIQKAGGYLSTGQPLKAAEKALPAFASNLVRAFRELDSVTTSSGKQVWDKNGKPYRPSTTETMQRASGFRGSERAMHEERQFEAKAELSRYGESRGKIYERYRAYVSDGAKDPVELKIIMDQVAAYNNRVLSAGRQAYVPLISREALRGQINRMRQPGRRERALLAATAD
jgi:N12 class adenine-specific DNA methylase